MSARATRGRPSRVQALDPKLKGALDALLRAGVTQAEILERINPHLPAGEAPLSRSGLNRYATRMEAVGRRLRDSREVAEAWVARLGSAPTGDVGRLLSEIVRTLAFEMATDDGLEATPELLKDLALVARRLEQSDRDAVARERAAREAEREACAERVKGLAGPGGLDAETLRRVREEIYGLPAEAG